LSRSVVYRIQSLFLAWHTLAILASAAPASHLMGKVYPLFKPYVNFFRIQNYWGFFSSITQPGAILRYTVENASGRKHEFRLTEDLKRSDPNFFGYHALHYSIQSKEGDYLNGAVRYLYGKHSALAPERIRFTRVNQLLISPQEYVEGHRPMDEGWIETEPLDWVSCG